MVLFYIEQEYPDDFESVSYMIPTCTTLKIPSYCKIIFNITAFTQWANMSCCAGRVWLSSQTILRGVQALNDITGLIVDSPVSWIDLDDVFSRASSKLRTFRTFLNGVRKRRLFQGIFSYRTFYTLIECTNGWSNFLEDFTFYTLSELNL